VKFIFDWGDLVKGQGGKGEMKDLFQKIFVLGGITYLLTSLFRKLL